MKDVTKILKPKQDKNKQNKMTEGKNLLRHSLQKNKTKNLCFYPQKKNTEHNNRSNRPSKKKYTVSNLIASPPFPYYASTAPSLLGSSWRVGGHYLANCQNWRRPDL